MRKIQRTKNQVRAKYDTVISAGYCKLQYLLNCYEPTTYCADYCGWRCDNYEIGGLLISTGYDPVKAKNSHADYDTCKKYDDKAKQLCHSISDYTELSKELDNLLSDFISEVTK